MAAGIADCSAQVVILTEERSAVYRSANSSVPEHLLTNLSQRRRCAAALEGCLSRDAICLRIKSLQVIPQRSDID